MESKQVSSATDKDDFKKQEQDYFQDDEDATTDSKGGAAVGDLKKQSSYTYWVQNNRDQFPQAKDKTLIAPKKIDDPDLLKQIEQSASQLTLNKTGSAWNTAGTW